MSKTESFLSKLKTLSTYKFTLPFLQEEITYRKLDVIEGSIDGSMPNFIASKVLEVMKKGLVGKDLEVDASDASNEDVKELLQKATAVWEKAVIDPKLKIDEIVQIPSEDRIAWFLEAVSQSYSSQTTSGSEVSVADVSSFPEERTSRRNAKRSSNS